MVSSKIVPVIVEYQKILLLNIKTNHFWVLIISESVIKIPTAYTIK